MLWIERKNGEQVELSFPNGEKVKIIFFKNPATGAMKVGFFSSKVRVNRVERDQDIYDQQMANFSQKVATQKKKYKEKKKIIH